jgi:hypothetical protein
MRAMDCRRALGLGVPMNLPECIERLGLRMRAPHHTVRGTMARGAPRPQRFKQRCRALPKPPAS